MHPKDFSVGGEGSPEPDDETKRAASLWRAVVAQHLRDLSIYGDNLSKTRHRHKVEAAQWFGFMDDVPHGTEGFFEVCGLGLMNAEILLTEIKDITTSDTSDAVKCFRLNHLASQLNRGPFEDRLKHSTDTV